MRKSSFVFCILLIAHNSAFAIDGPNRFLKGVRTIAYQPIVERPVGGAGCKIDLDNLNTSLQFIANQSAVLKVITSQEKFERYAELAERLRNLSSENSAQIRGAAGVEQAIAQFEKGQKALKPASAAADEYLFMPMLYITFTPLQIAGGCAASIDAKLTASIEPTRIKATQTEVYHETIEIWSEGYGIVGTQPTFSDQAIKYAEQILKKLVNDWAASQH
jgi:hypothetical protein